MIVQERPDYALIHRVALGMRDRDFEEIAAVSWGDSREEIAEWLATLYQGGDTTIVTGPDPQTPACVLSWIPVRPRVWAMGMFATEAFPTIGRGMTRLIIHDIVPALSRSGAHRIFAQSIAGYEEVHAWLRFLGLVQAHHLPKYGKNGEDFVELAYVRPDGLDSFRWLGPGRVG